LKKSSYSDIMVAWMLLNFPELAMVKEKKVRGFKPVRVLNPKLPMHTTYVCPRQSINLILSEPFAVTSNCSSDAFFEVKLDSEYFLFSGVKRNEFNQQVYTIVQKYDLESWSRCGECYLGDIIVSLKNNNHEDAKDCPFTESRVKVSLVDSKDRRVLSVINPQKCEVRLEPHKLLEVIVSENSWNNNGEGGRVQSDGFDDAWRVEVQDFEIEQEGIFLKSIKNIVLYQSSDSVKESDTNSVLQRYRKSVNPKLKEEIRDSVQRELDKTKKPCREHHFFFTFSDESRKRINKLRNGDYRLAQVTLIGKCIRNPELCVTRNFTLYLSIHGKKKMPNTGLHVERKLELSKRIYDKQKASLINPTTSEQIDFYVGYEVVNVEIAHPSLWWAGEPADARWQIEVDDQYVARENLNIIPNGDFTRSGVSFQSFAIKIKDNAEPLENKFLGAVKVIYPSRQSSHEGTKRISCWMVLHPSKSKKVTVHSAGGKQEHWKTGIGWYYEGSKPQRMKVEFEDITGATLESGAQTRKVSDIYVPPNYHQDYEYGSGYCRIYGPPIAKKKIVPESSTRSGNHQINQATEVTTTSTKNSVMPASSSSTTGMNIVANNSEPSIWYNPSNFQDITVDEGKDIVIRMSPPSVILDNGKCEGELWSISERAIGDRKPTITDQRVFVNNNGSTSSCFQEIRVVLDNRTSSNAGTHQAGAVCFSCSECQRIVRFHVNYLSRYDPEVPWGLPSDVHYVVPQSYHEAQSISGPKRYVYVCDWEHNDAVVIKTNDVTYIKIPKISDKWNSESWSVQLIQHEIPVRVWDKLAQSNKAMMDRYKAWFAKFPPLYLSHTICLKALSSQQPMIDEILNNLANVTEFDCFPIAALVFENNAYAENKSVITKFGNFETVTKVKRILHICADIKGRRKEKRIVTRQDPLNNDEIEVLPGDYLNLILSSDYVECKNGQYVESHWYQSIYPSFLIFKGHSSGEKTTTFRYEVNKNAATLNECIKFRCGENEKRIMIRVGC
jgi:hypothetical protein